MRHQNFFFNFAHLFMLLVAFMCHINTAAHEAVAIALSGHHRILLLCALPWKLIEKQDKEPKA